MTTLRKLKGHTDCVNDVAFSSDGQLLFSAGDDDCVRVWNVADGKQTQRFSCEQTGKFEQPYVKSVSVSNDNASVAAACIDTNVRVFDVATGKCKSALRGHTEWIRGVAFAPHKSSSNNLVYSCAE